jgi:hypothetical protein
MKDPDKESISKRPLYIKVPPEESSRIVTSSPALTLIIWGIKFIPTEHALNSQVMGKDWLAGEVCGRKELLILLMCSSICLLDLSFHGRNFDHIFSILACCSSFKKIWKDMVMVWIGNCSSF